MHRLIWIDLEMTGLRPETDRILEIATIITDEALNVIEEGPALAVHQEESVLAQMDTWCQETHERSGLLARVRKSTVTEKSAEQETLAFLKKHLLPKKSPMCGNSICMDRRFLYRYMPSLEAYFHYRHIDVSTVKELARLWAPAVLEGFQKESKHEAREDILESIEELRYYYQLLHKKGVPPLGEGASPGIPQ